MRLDWKAQPVPGKSMFNLELGTSYADVMNLLEGCKSSNGIIQIENSGPRSSYDESKRCAEAILAAAERNGIGVRVARLFNVYGPR
jgi:nucleoside-diphosphate-sugar epimerase